MIRINSTTQIDEGEFTFTFSTAGGPGGQNVNKVATRATLRFCPAESRSLSEIQKSRVIRFMAGRLDGDGVLRIVGSRHRTQSANRRDVIERFVALLQTALRPIKRRVPTRPSKASRQRRLTGKRLQGERKQSRRKQFGRDTE